MREDPHQPRFFAYLSLFTFSMLMLVTANNFLQMFFGWEGVGLASYLLIGFWYTRPQPTPPRSRPSWSIASAISASRSASSACTCISHADFSAVFAAAPAMAGKTLHLRRPSCRHPDDALPAAVCRRDGQVGADRSAHLAAGCHGRPDAGLRADPCGDDGDGGRISGVPLLAAVRTCADCAGCRHVHRRHDRVLRRHASVCSRTTSSA